ncbi:peptide/nickel transport system ATP-binding protein [Thermocatellispora tengchongensis]|uniref:Peptide/nickel transport system ATP-binding protein n=1 Tax=Thermocatellispora tengchongensis TaxID=1073253 RepID=A0A840P932_9ACTN|nr:ABC transporter ATP-binding protein [Thermocatellispora tengchongensis]MBB5135802.1 peptide/nickel transport system ATP-binding protein [Thermocatellispora tengchongensis]
MTTPPPAPLAAEDVTLGYGGRAVVHGVTLAVDEGGVGLIGESGSGKTTLARALLGLLRPLSGRVLYEGRDLAGLGRRELAGFRGAVQPVFQDGSEALDPRMRVGSSIAEALTAHHRMGAAERKARIAELLTDVGLDPEHAGRRPHQLSGGQRQRAVIARALAVRPRALVLDEPTSALDVTVQARILDLLSRLREEHGLGYLLITHNLAVVDRLCRTSHVLFAGRVVESGPTRDLLTRPAHPYTHALRAAVPTLARASDPGEPDEAGGPGGPDLGRAVRLAEAPAADAGCAFRHRCPLAIPRCSQETPILDKMDGRRVACHRAEEVLAGALRQ